MKALFYGIALAAFSGVAMGAALKPAFQAFTDDITSSPPGFATGVIIDQADAGPEYTSSGPWVMGTDYLRASEPVIVEAYMGDSEPMQIAEYDQPAEPMEPASAPEMEETDYPGDEARYPSQGGGIVDDAQEAVIIPVFDPA
ncbi:hypothetical protein [Caulobacter sp. NIBR2454]|uniref:hypothetical protein n=1 Tax=Caulobacter sp. NIBR2454 TaxID=3015996 RepID=UPI0022B6AF33|nr:hypothetical protein [Caulobacter sp. NIBR2454]